MHVAPPECQPIEPSLVETNSQSEPFSKAMRIHLMTYKRT